MSEKSSEDMIDWMGQTVHRAYHDRYPDFWTCPKDVCASAAQHLREREAPVVAPVEADKEERPLYKLARSEAETALQCLSSVIHEIVQRSMPETREPNVDFMLSQLENSRIAISRARRYCENVKPDDPDETNEEIAVELAIAEVDKADRDWLGRGR